MKKYVCDLCNKIIDDPYKMRLREFCIEDSVTTFGFRIPINKMNEKTIDLCDSCYEKLIGVRNNID